MKPTFDDFQIVTSSEALADLEDDWNALWHKVGGLHHLSFKVCWLCWTIIASPQGRVLRVITIRKGGELVLVWPLVLHRRMLWRVLDPLQPGTAERTSMLVADGPLAHRAVARAWEVATRLCRADLLFLPYIDAGSTLHRLAREHSGIMAESSDVFMVARLPRDDDWAGYCATLGTLSGRKPGARERRLAKKGQLEMRVIAPQDPANFEQWVNWIFEHKCRWADRKGARNTWLKKSTSRDFLVALLKSTDPNAPCRLCTITLDGTPIAAAVIGLGCTTLVGIVMAFDEQAAKLDPGLLVVEQSVKLAFDLNLDMEFGLGTERFKAYWSKNNRVLTESLEIAATPWGRLGFHVKRFVNEVKNRGFRRVQRKQPDEATPSEPLNAPPAA